MYFVHVGNNKHVYTRLCLLITRATLREKAIKSNITFHLGDYVTYIQCTGETHNIWADYSLNAWLYQVLCCFYYSWGCVYVHLQLLIELLYLAHSLYLLLDCSRKKARTSIFNTNDGSLKIDFDTTSFRSI